jgi:hypothetical protein
LNEQRETAAIKRPPKGQRRANNDGRCCYYPDQSVCRVVQGFAYLKADAKTGADAAKADVEAMILGTKVLE